MQSININDNNNKEIVFAKRKINHTLIVYLSVFGAILGCMDYIDNPYNINLFLLLATTYVLNVIILVVLMKLLINAFYPRSLKIEDGKIVLFIGLLKITIMGCSLSMDNNLVDGLKEKLISQFKTNDPSIFMIKVKDKAISFIVDKGELDKISKGVEE